jgi:hypothetical protein
MCIQATTYSILATLRIGELLPPAEFFPIVLEFAAADSDNWWHRKTRCVRLSCGI